jgi:hypothetical protein
VKQLTAALPFDWHLRWMTLIADLPSEKADQCQSLRAATEGSIYQIQDNLEVHLKLIQQQHLVEKKETAKEEKELREKLRAQVKRREEEIAILRQTVQRLREDEKGRHLLSQNWKASSAQMTAQLTAEKSKFEQQRKRTVAALEQRDQAQKEEKAAIHQLLAATKQNADLEREMNSLRESRTKEREEHKRTKEHLQTNRKGMTRLQMRLATKEARKQASNTAGGPAPGDQRIKKDEAGSSLFQPDQERKMPSPVPGPPTPNPETVPPPPLPEDTCSKERPHQSSTSKPPRPPLPTPLVKERDEPAIDALLMEVDVGPPMTPGRDLELGLDGPLDLFSDLGIE